MTRKDYIKLAECFRLTEPEENDSGRMMWCSLRSRISEMLKIDNSRFDEEKFKKACLFIIE